VVIYLSVKNIDGQIHKQSDGDIENQLDVNIFGFLNVLRACTPTLREKGWGRVIYVSSVLAHKPIRGTGIYSASKSFCESIIKTHSLENSKYGITSNSIRLGYFDGGLTEKVPSEILHNVIKSIPQKRLGESEEISNLIETIINTEYINGTTISITGGYENI
jgi:NAD(P)-dependent dehydrogenase (short-subunit alcohol dehydrogenase family)